MAITTILEVMTVANTCQIALPEDAVETTMSRFDMLPAKGTTSMHRDIAEGRPSEFDAQIGAVVRLGAKGKVKTPLHSFIYGSLLPMEMRARGQIQFAT
jgi:2-dehydropantoate 2-reductase